MTRSLLGHRLLSAAKLARYELEIKQAIGRALDQHLRHANRALTASIDPDPFGLTTWDDDVDAEVTPVIRDILQEVAAGTVSFLALPESVKSLVLGRIDVDYEAVSFTARIKGIGPDVADELRQTLNQGSSLGESIPKLQQRVQDVFDVGTRRGETIARTEIHAAAERTSNTTAAAMHAETPLLKTWVATLDPRTRDEHSAADGQQVPFDQPFDVGGEPLDYPGDPAGSAENTVNCRCSCVYDEDTTSVGEE